MELPDATAKKVLTFHSISYISPSHTFGACTYAQARDAIGLGKRQPDTSY